jgi:hypothetical protein
MQLEQRLISSVKGQKHKDGEQPLLDKKRKNLGQRPIEFSVVGLLPQRFASPTLYRAQSYSTWDPTGVRSGQRNSLQWFFFIRWVDREEHARNVGSESEEGCSD